MGSTLLTDIEERSSINRSLFRAATTILGTVLTVAPFAQAQQKPAAKPSATTWNWKINEKVSKPGDCTFTGPNGKEAWVGGSSSDTGDWWLAQNVPGADETIMRVAVGNTSSDDRSVTVSITQWNKAGKAIGGTSRAATQEEINDKMPTIDRMYGECNAPPQAKPSPK